MRALVDGTNIDPIDGDYPKGKVRDKNGGAGTILNEVLLGDFVQFFQKLIIDAGITENDLPDNVSNGYQLMEALESKIKDESPFVQLVAPPNTDYTIDTTNAFIRTNNKGVTEFKGHIIVTQNVAAPFVIICTIPAANRATRNIGVNVSLDNSPVASPVGGLILSSSGSLTIAGIAGTNTYYLDTIRFVK